MHSQLMVTIDRPIKSAALLNDVAGGSAGAHHNSPGDNPQAASHELVEQLQQQMELFAHTNDTLNALIVRLRGYSSEMLAKHKEEIAQLSVEIARRVLVQRIEDSDYDIEQVIKEAVGSMPSDDDVVVHLNPEDLALLQSARQQSGAAQPENVKLTADASVGRAECFVETPKGLVESRINQKLEQISSVLKKAH